MRIVLAAFAIVHLLASCVPPVDSVLPKINLPPAYRNAATDPASLGDLSWRQLFLDPQLRALLGEALIANADVNVAVQRVYVAQGQLGETTAAQRPNVAGVASVNYMRSQGAQPGGSSHSETIAPALFGQTASPFDVDVFHTLRYATAAQRARLLSSDATRQSVLTTVVDNLATAYFQLQELHRERDITNLAVANRRDNLRIVHLQVVGGTATLQAQRQAEFLLFQATSTVPDIDRQIGEEEDAIATLLGQYPAPIPRGLPVAEQLADVAVPPSGLPGQLLLRRPDIRSAELTLESDNLQVASARAAIFPQLTLGSSYAGVGGTIVNGLAYGPQGLLSLVPAFAQTLFDGRLKRSVVDLDRAQREADVYAYLQTIQFAMQSVNDGLIDYAQYRAAVAQQRRLTAALGDYARLANLRYRAGVGNYLDVLDSESRLFTAELTLAQTEVLERIAEANLYRALGGGWQDAPDPLSAPANRAAEASQGQNVTRALPPDAADADRCTATLNALPYRYTPRKACPKVPLWVRQGPSTR